MYKHMKYTVQLTILSLIAAGAAQAELPLGDGVNAWESWFGNFHYIFVHFPIALIVMVGVAELISSWRKNPQYNLVINFLLIAAAVFVIPTVFSGLSLEESGVVPETNPYLEWHETFGIATLVLTCITLILRTFFKWRTLYLLSLLALLICVAITSHLGGLMAFGDFSLLPPFFH